MRQYQINGKTVSREIFHQHLLTGNWQIANLSNFQQSNVYIPPKVEEAITPELAKQIREQHRRPSTEIQTES